MREDAPLKVEAWPIEKVIAYASNLRKRTAAAGDKLAASIKEFGWKQPIVVDVGGVIVVGHTRLRAAQKVGLETVPVHLACRLTPQQVPARVGSASTAGPSAAGSGQSPGRVTCSARLSDCPRPGSPRSSPHSEELQLRP